MTIEIKDLGKLTRYNGVDILQTKYYTKLHNTTYINKLEEEHSWLTENNNTSEYPLPMISTPENNREIESAIPPATDIEQKQLQIDMNINYRQVIGELIFLMITCRPDISYPLIKLSQYSQNPAKIHYESAKNLLKYVVATKTEGIYFWRTTPNNNLPYHPLPTTKTSNYNNEEIRTYDKSNIPHGTVDSDWGSDTNHRRSVTGIVIRLAGGTIIYKTKFQDTIALSSTEAEYTAACDAGKAILYVRYILDEINMPQESATTLYIDNNGALMMGNAQQPTRRTRHMDIKKFSLNDWIEKDIIIMKRIATKDNYSDGLTKNLGRQLFYRQFEYVLGKIRPSFTDHITITEINNENDDSQAQSSNDTH